MSGELLRKPTFIALQHRYQDDTNGSQNQLKDVPESDVDSLELAYCDPELPVGIRE